MCLGWRDKCNALIDPLLYESKGNMMDILVKQKQAIRIIAGVNYREHNIQYLYSNNYKCYQ